MTRHHRKVTRSALLFAAGLAGIGAETYSSLRYNHAPDSGLIFVFAAMMGLPAFLRADTKGQDDEDQRDNIPDPGKPDPSDREDSAPPTAR